MDDQDAVAAAYWKGVAQAKERTLDLQAVEFKQRESRWLARIAELEGELERERRYSQTKAAGERSWQQIAENTATEHDATLALLARAYPWLHNPYRGTVDVDDAAEGDAVIEAVELAIQHVPAGGYVSRAEAERIVLDMMAPPEGQPAPTED